MDIAKLGIRRVVGLSYDAALEKLPALLKAEGFGVLTEIDVKKTLHEKLGVEFRRYKILGACNPPAAHKVLTAEPEIGLLLPCNVVVYEGADGRTVVSAFDPMQLAEAQGRPEIQAIAEDVGARLRRVVAAL
jgi:uncharacterized protein (DUF302 family)